MANSHSDVVAITQLVNLYGLAVDSRQWHLFDSIFTADVDADYGASSHWTNLEQFKSDFAAFHDLFDSTQHTMSTHVVDVEGLAAHSFCNGAGVWCARPPMAARSGTARAGTTTHWCTPRLAGGSAAGSAASRGGPVTRRVNEGIPGVKFDLATSVLRREADAGRIGVLGAHAKPDI